MTGHLETDVDTLPQSMLSPATARSGSTTPGTPSRGARQRTTSSSTGEDLSPGGQHESGSTGGSAGLTPTRRNKRKMTAPKRRSDFSMKRFCPDLVSGGDATTMVVVDDVVDDPLEEYDRLGRECVPERTVRGSTSSLDSRDSRPNSTGHSSTYSPADLHAIYNNISGSGTGDITYSRRPSSILSPGQEDIEASRDGGLSPPAVASARGSSSNLASGYSSNQRASTVEGAEVVGPRRRDRRRWSNVSDEVMSEQQQQQQQQQQQHLMGLHHPAFGLSRHLQLTGGLSLPLTLPSHHHLSHPTGQANHPTHHHATQANQQTLPLFPLPNVQIPPYTTTPTSTSSPPPGPFIPPSPSPGPPSPTDSTCSTADGCSSSGGKKTRKNYKNMTRGRRVEANARERSRVHTISAAFESLRRAVPSYSYNQKLSKLAILRIACSYILSLAKLADQDYSEQHRDYSFADCVDMCTSVIQTEGRARRRH